MAGDHLIVVSRVHRLHLGEDCGVGPLVFYRGGYGRFRSAVSSAREAPAYVRAAHPRTVDGH